METFEVDVTTHQAMAMWRERAPMTVRIGNDRATMAIESMVSHPSGWSTLTFRRIRAV